MAARSAKKIIDPWKCESCGAMVFVVKRFHDAICFIYKRDPVMVAGSHSAYEDIKSSKPTEKIKTKRKRKS